MKGTLVSSVGRCYRSVIANYYHSASLLQLHGNHFTDCRRTQLVADVVVVVQM